MHTPNVDWPRAERGQSVSHARSARHGLLGLPLAFVAMPLYVLLPEHHARSLGLPLAALGVALMLARLADAWVDPWLGRLADRLLSAGGAPLALCGGALGLAVGFAALFSPPAWVQGTAASLAWALAAMGLTFGAYSLAQVLYLAWGTRLGGDLAGRARIVAWRESWGLVGVILANVLALQWGLMATCVALVLSLALGVLAVCTGPRPEATAGRAQKGVPGPADAAMASAPSHAPDVSSPGDHAKPVHPWRVPAFRALMQVYLLNGVASALPATLVLFYIDDRLQARAQAPLFLGLYFLTAALSVPLWTRAVARWGAWPAWAAGMALSVPPFLAVLLLGPGDAAAYLVVCLLCGAALGADLSAPGTLFTSVVKAAGHAGQAEGAYAGWWHWGAKFNLALAAGLALPALQLLGYQPGLREPEGLLALGLVYGLLPCVFKLLALLQGWRARALLHPAGAH
jgi:GPH family glycoside/pentoside/hexuronide:cation symporter